MPRVTPTAVPESATPAPDTAVSPSPTPIPTPAQTGASFAADTVATLRDGEITLTYTFVNTGSEPLTDLSITDSLVGDPRCSATSVVPGQVATCAALYTVTAGSDATATSDAVFTAIDPDGTVLTAATSVSLVVRAEPGLSLTAVIDAPVATVGSTVTVIYTVTNTGNVDIDDLTIRDLELDDPLCESTVLGPGESTTCPTSFELDMSDITTGAIQLDSIVTGNASLTAEPVVAELHEALPIDATLIPTTHLIFGSTLIF